MGRNSRSSSLASTRSTTASLVAWPLPRAALVQSGLGAFAVVLFGIATLITTSAFDVNERVSDNFHHPPADVGHLPMVDGDLLKADSAASARDAGTITFDIFPVEAAPCAKAAAGREPEEDSSSAAPAPGVNLRASAESASAPGSALHEDVSAPEVKAEAKAAAAAGSTSNDRPAAVVVFGMHHTGTSILTLLLMQLGITAGPRSQLLILDNNPVKFFELGKAVGLDEAFVNKYADGLTPAWPAYGYEWGRAPRAEQLAFNEGVANITAGLDALAGPNKTWVLKDPRLCLVAESYLSQIQRKRICIITVRDPIEGAARFMRFTRGWPLGKNLEVWEEYNVRAIQGCRRAGAAVLFAKHEVLMTKPFEFATKIHDELLAAGAKGIFMPSQEDFERDFLRLWYKPRANDSRSALSFDPRMRQVFERLISRRAKRVWEAQQAENIDLLTDAELLHTSWTHA